MRLTVPVTGTVLSVDSEKAKLDGHGVSGDPNDPVRWDVNLGNVSARLISIDLESSTAILEITPGPVVAVPDLDDLGKQKTNSNGKVLWKSRDATDTEKQGFLADAQVRVAKYVPDPAKKLKMVAAIQD